VFYMKVTERVQRLTKSPGALHLRKLWSNHELLWSIVQDERWPVCVREKQLKFLVQEAPLVRDAVLLTVALEGVAELAKEMQHSGRGRDGTWIGVTLAWPLNTSEFGDDPGQLWFPDIYTHFEPPEVRRYDLERSSEGKMFDYVTRELAPLVDASVRENFDFTTYGGDEADEAMFALVSGQFPRLTAGVDRFPSMNWRRFAAVCQSGDC
jgi:hypothetical protein